MTPRDRFINQALGLPVDRGVLWEDRYWPETLDRWRREGMDSLDGLGNDFREMAAHEALPVATGFWPPFEERVLEDRGGTLLVQDSYGVHKEVFRQGTGMPRFVRFPIGSRADWERLTPRLAADAPGRFADGWQESARRVAAEGTAPVTLCGGHLCGFFSFLRELAGDACYTLFYDDPGLVRDMVAFQEDRLCRLIRQATAAVAVDRLFIWEDMCCRNGPLIGPGMFRQFLFPACQRVIAAAVAGGVKVVDLDSDGNVDALIPVWLEAGVNMLHPFEVQAGMDVNRVRRSFGRGFAMRGGVDKRALAAGRRAIDAELERIRPACLEGRCIPHVDHSVPPDVSWGDYRYYRERLARMMGA